MNAAATPSSHRRLTLACLLAAVVVTTFHTTGARGEVIDRIVAHVNEEILTQTDIVRLLPIYVEVYGVDPEMFGALDSCTTFVDDFVQFLVTSKLLARDAVDRELAVTDEEVEAYIRDQYQRLRLTQEQFVDELAGAGIDILDFREFMELNLNRVRILQIDVAARVAVSESDIDRAIEERYPDGLSTTNITTSHVFVQVTGTDAQSEAAARSAIEARYQRILAGEPFEEVAAENDDGTRRTGGRIGAFATTDLDPIYAEAALALDVGQVSPPVRSGFGYHLIRLEAVSREEITDAERIRSAVRFELQNAETENQQSVYLDRVRNGAFVEIKTNDFGYCASLN